MEQSRSLPYYCIFRRSIRWGAILALSGMLASAQTQLVPAPADAAKADLTSLDIEALLNVEVTTASRFSDKLGRAPAVMSVVTADELRRFGGMRLSEVLQRVPGLTISTSVLADRSLIAARGDQTRPNGGHIVFLINGRPTREVMEGGNISDLLESFPIEILERIEIIKGPGSVLYGSNAFSAVVNLITIKAEKNQAAATALGKEGGGLSAAVTGTYRKGAFSIAAAAQLHQKPDWNVTYVVPLAERNAVIGPHAPDVQQVDVIDRGSGAYVDLNYRGVSFTSAFTEFQSDSFIEGDVGETRLTRVFGNLGYEYQAARNWNMKFNGTFTRTTFDDVSYPSIGTESREAIGEWTNLVTLSSRDRLTAGALFSRIDGIESLTDTRPNKVIAEGGRPAGAFYAQLDHELLDNLSVIAGFQTNKIGSIALDTVPRIGLVWTPARWSSVKALYGKAFRAPSIEENLVHHPALTGNPNLLPEKVSTLDLSLGFQRNRFEAAIDYFHSEQTGSITPRFTPAQLVEYVNLGELTFNGIEAQGKAYLQKSFYVQGSMLHQTNVDGSHGRNLTPIPTLGFKVGASYEHRRGLTVGIFDVRDGRVQGYSGVNPVSKPRHIVNAHLRYDLPKHRVAVVIHASNLAGTTVWLPGSFGMADNIPVQQGRAVYAGLEFLAGRN